MSAAETLFIPRKVWTRDEVNRLSWDGLSLELINGELIDRMGKRPPHIFWLSVLRGWFFQHFGIEFVRSEDPIDVAPQDNPTSEPEPDLAVTKSSLRETRGANPNTSDLRLVVEVSDSTFEFDRRVKAELYARADIREYWVVDVRVAEMPRLLVFREPREGRYGTCSIYSHTETIEVLGEKQLRLSELL